jgi:phosphate-selective porin
VFADTVFFDRVFVNGPRRRMGVDAAWSRGPASLTAELAATTDGRHGMGIDGEDLPSLGARAWYLAGSWVLTGERKRARVEPRRAVTDGGFGAVEVAARLERLSFDTVLYPGGATHGPDPRDLAGNGEWVGTLGASWFPHSRVKVQGNLVIESVDDPTRSPAPRGNGRFTSGIVNFQFVL